jgi:hypothetical protein
MSIDALREKNRKIVRAISLEIGERLRLVLRVGTALPPKISALMKKLRKVERKE